MNLGALVATVLVAIILIPTVIIPAVNDYTMDTGRGWQYDDYRRADDLGAQAASGALEIVTIDGIQYVHAADVGPGTITTGNGVKNIVVEKAVLDAFMMYGQSNASYRNAVPVLASPVPPLGVGYFWGLEHSAGTSTGEGLDVSECDFWEMYDSDGILRIGAASPAFAATYYKNTGHKVYWIDTAIGDKGISLFQPPDALVWTYGDEMLTAALAAVDTDLFDISIHYYMWIQGEASRTVPIDEYKTLFLNMHDALLDGEMAATTFEKCYISKVSAEKGGNAALAQIELAQEYPDSIIMATTIADTFTVENGLLGTDELHYTQHGNNLIGEALANAIAPPQPARPSDVTKDLVSIIPVLLIASVVMFVALAIASRNQ